ncbi:MAG: phosphoribosyl-ATP diphosphatase [Clostridia bacterium]
MIDILREEFLTVEKRKTEKVDGSYTCYLLEKGTDKILKKCGEECSEVIIAAKNKDKEELTCELSDLIYHLAVLMSNENITMEMLEEEFEKRHGKQSNLKQFHQVDKNT